MQYIIRLNIEDVYLAPKRRSVSFVFDYRVLTAEAMPQWYACMRCSLKIEFRSKARFEIILNFKNVRGHWLIYDEILLFSKTVTFLMMHFWPNDFL